jgi:SAM-dependent methyltransferase
LLAALGLLTRASHNPELWSATVMLYPRGPLMLASDRATRVDGAPANEHDDIVFSALTDNTERFLDLLPCAPCERFLDLGAGTGVAALTAAAGWADHAWAVDVTERATGFAEFNRRLNGLENVTTLQGDLYAPVKDLTFDCIAIHPPYVPAARQRIVYQDGGLDGQEVTRRAVEGLPRYLSPGGRFYCLSLGADRDGLAFEHWVRAWLGRQHAEFDVAFVPRNTITPEFLARSVAIKGGGVPEATRLHEAFEGLGIREFVYGALVIQRHDAPRAAFTVRRQRANRSRREEIAWLLGWETRRATRTDAAWLLDARPVASPDLELRVVHRLVEGALTPVTYTLQTEYPFSMESAVAPWMAALVARCDGAATGREHYHDLREQGAFPAGVSEAEFGRLLATLVSGGFIEIPGLTLPRDGSS